MIIGVRKITVEVHLAADHYRELDAAYAELVKRATKDIPRERVKIGPARYVRVLRWSLVK